MFLSFLDDQFDKRRYPKILPSVMKDIMYETGYSEREIEDIVEVLYKYKIVD